MEEELRSVYNRLKRCDSIKLEHDEAVGRNVLQLSI